MKNTKNKTIPKAPFEYMFEQIKQFYNVIHWSDYGEVKEFIDGKFSLPDKVSLQTFDPDFLPIFEDKLILRFFKKAGIAKNELDKITLILIGVNAVHIERMKIPEDMSEEDFYDNDPEGIISIS